MKTQLFISIIGFVFLSACDAPSSGNNNKYYNDTPQETYLIPPEEVTHQDIEVIEEGQVMIEDFVEEDNWTEVEAEQTEETADFVGYHHYQPTAQNRLSELAKMSIYRKQNGKLKRLKIARQLNEEGYRKSNGKKFRIRDIPKYSNN